MAETNDAGVPAVTEFDLLPKLVSRLDRHLIFPLLEFSASALVDEDDEIKDEAKAREITRAKYELLKKTNMTDYVANLYCELEGLENPPAEFADKRAKVLARLEKYEDDTSKLTDLLGREDVVSNLRSDKVANLEFLKKEHDVRSCPGFRWGINPWESDSLELTSCFYRSPLNSSMRSTTSATSNTAAATTARLPTCCTSSAFCQLITTRWPTRHGASWRRRFSARTGNRPWRS